MHCMLDLETLDTKPTSLILSIGAVSFDEGGINEEFYEIIKIDDFMMNNFTISAATLNWWLKQSEAITEFAKASTGLFDALYNFSQFYVSNDCDALWGNGVDFDNVILANAYSKFQANMAQPWKYYHNNCFRTIKSRFEKLDKKFEGVKHNALADAKFQAEYLIELNKVNALNIL